MNDDNVLKTKKILNRKAIKYSLPAILVIGILFCVSLMLPQMRDFIIRIIETNLLHRRLQDLNKWHDFLFRMGYGLTIVFTVVLLFVIIVHFVVNRRYFTLFVEKLKPIVNYLSKNKIFIYVIWTGFGIFLLYSMCNVFMYFDDFGLASLSYAYVEPDVQGQNFTFSQLRHFLWQTYLNWSGRIVFLGFLILMLHNVWIYRIVQSITVLISFIALCRLSSGKRLSAATALFSVSLYGVFHFEMFRSGFYWFTASAIYVLPLAFFFAGSLVMRNIENNPKTGLGHIIIGSFFFFMAGISQEQTAFTLVTFIMILCIFDYIQNKKIKLSRFPFLLASIFGSGLLLLAPGNFRRFQAGEMDSPMSLFQTIKQNLFTMSDNYLNLTDNMPFLILFACFICYIGYILWKANKINKFVCLAMFPYSLFFLLLPVIFNKFNKLQIYLYALFYICYALFSIYIITKYLVHIKDRYLAAFFYGALFSQITMLFYSPYIVERMKIIFYFALFALFIRTFADMWATISKKELLVCVLLPVMLMSSINLAYITNGYSLNKQANIYNDNLLKKASQDIKAGKELKEIDLVTMPNARFANDFHEFIHWWLREFYDIPNDIPIHYAPYW